MACCDAAKTGFDGERSMGKCSIRESGRDQNLGMSSPSKEEKPNARVNRRQAAKRVDVLLNNQLGWGAKWRRVETGMVWP